mgnify:CR=1 FL=1
MSIKETSIDKIAGEEYLTVYSNEKAIVNKIKELKSQYPTEVIIIKEYEESLGETTNTLINRLLADEIKGFKKKKKK